MSYIYKDSECNALLTSISINFPKIHENPSCINEDRELIARYYF